MRKLLLVISLFVISAVVYAAQPNNIGQASTDGPFGLWNRTLAQINALTPDTTGQLVYCSNCVNSSVCVSSSVYIAGWVSTMSSGTVAGIPHCN